MSEFPQVGYMLDLYTWIYERKISQFVNFYPLILPISKLKFKIFSCVNSLPLIGH